MSAFRPSKPTGPYLVKGIQDGGKKLAPKWIIENLIICLEVPGIRQELREFKKNTDLWNLYLLGLWQFQLIPKEDQLSYFQIAGENLS
jgi:hypothetical protein